MSREDKKRSNKQWNKNGRGKSSKLDQDSDDGPSGGSRNSAWDDVEYLSKEDYYEGYDEDDWDVDDSEFDDETEEE